MISFSGGESFKDFQFFCFMSLLAVASEVHSRELRDIAPIRTLNGAATANEARISGTDERAIREIRSIESLATIEPEAAPAVELPAAPADLLSIPKISKNTPQDQTVSNVSPKEEAASIPSDANAVATLTVGQEPARLPEASVATNVAHSPPPPATDLRPNIPEWFPAALGRITPLADAQQPPQQTDSRSHPPLANTFPWREDIVATVFWVGEQPTARNPTPNCKSAWDRSWTQNFGGYDNPAPEKRRGYRPKKFRPRQNPFYIALPYNDIGRTGSRYGSKSSAKKNIPWFCENRKVNGSVLKGRWLALRRGDRVCYAQWEDVGPFETDDWRYVFGDQKPKNRHNRSAGIDVSPAIRDYLGFDGGYGTLDWRFVEADEVPAGPWKDWQKGEFYTDKHFAPKMCDDTALAMAE